MYLLFKLQLHGQFGLSVQFLVEVVLKVEQEIVLQEFNQNVHLEPFSMNREIVMKMHVQVIFQASKIVTRYHSIFRILGMQSPLYTGFH